MKREKLFGRAINRMALDLRFEDDRILAEYIIDYLEKMDIKYIIATNVLNRNWIHIRVDCDNEMMSILRQLIEDFEYDFDEEGEIALV